MVAAMRRRKRATRRDWKKRERVRRVGRRGAEGGEEGGGGEHFEVANWVFGVLAGWWVEGWIGFGEGRGEEGWLGGGGWKV